MLQTRDSSSSPELIIKHVLEHPWKALEEVTSISLCIVKNFHFEFQHENQKLAFFFFFLLFDQLISNILFRVVEI